MMVECGKACLSPGLPADSRREPILAAVPMHHVATGGFRYCMVS